MAPLWIALNNSVLAKRVDAAAVIAGRIGSYDTYDPFSSPSARSAAAMAWQQSASRRLSPESQQLLPEK